MAELYWLAQIIEVPFRKYGTNPLVAAALADINAFTEPRHGGEADASNGVSGRRQAISTAPPRPGLTQSSLSGAVGTPQTPPQP